MPIATADTNVERAESFFVALSGVTNATLGRDAAVATIIDDDTVAPLPAASVGDVLVDERAGLARFVVSLDHASAGEVRFDFATVDGTAQAGSDYAATSGTLVFAPGETTKTVSVIVLDDARAEAAETFGLTLSNGLGGTIAHDSGVATIWASDAAAVARPSVSILDATVHEDAGFVDVTVALSAPGQSRVSLNFSTHEGTATSRDYTGRGGTFTFDPGEMVKTFRVPITNDAVVEARETFSADISGVSGATVARSTATITIIDDDRAAMLIHDMAPVHTHFLHPDHLLLF